MVAVIMEEVLVAVVATQVEEVLAAVAIRVAEDAKQSILNIL